MFKIEGPVCFMRCAPGTIPRVDLYDVDPAGCRQYTITAAPGLHVPDTNNTRTAEELMRELLLSAAVSMIGYDASYGGGGGLELAFEIAQQLGYEDGLSEHDVQKWLLSQMEVRP